MTDEDVQALETLQLRVRELEARHDEAEYALATARERAVQLNVQVRLRDEEIVRLTIEGQRLRTELAAERAEPVERADGLED